MIVASVFCTQKREAGGQAVITFSPDYQDARNRKWSAAATPDLHLYLTVRDEIAEHFEPGQRYTLALSETGESS